MGFLYGIAGARILGPTDFGQLTVIVATVHLVASPFNLRLGEPLIRMVRGEVESSDSSKETNTITIAHLAQFISISLFLVLFFLFLVILPPYFALFRNWQIALGLYAISEGLKRLRFTGPIFNAFEWFESMAVFQIATATLRNLVPAFFMFQ